MRTDTCLLSFNNLILYKYPLAEWFWGSLVMPGQEPQRSPSPGQSGSMGWGHLRNSWEGKCKAGSSFPPLPPDNSSQGTR